MTRQNVVPLSGEPSAPRASTPALIPFWDFCNHTQGELTTQFELANDRAECFALRDFVPGEQIFIFYGVRSNGYFFLYNGFVYPDNLEDSLELSLGISSQDPLHALKTEALAQLSPPPYLLHGAPRDPLSPALLHFARVQVMTLEELTSWLESNKTGPAGEKESPEVAQRALVFLHTRCRLLLAAYTTHTTLPDPPSTDSLNIDPSHRNLINQLKESEMKILQRAIDYTQPSATP